MRCTGIVRQSVTRKQTKKQNKFEPLKTKLPRSKKGIDITGMVLYFRRLLLHGAERKRATGEIERAQKNIAHSFPKCYVSILAFTGDSTAN